jgi:uncharacterized protein (DUF1778 family)
VVRISLCVSPEQRDLIDRAAYLLGKDRSEFVLEAACEEAQSALLDRVFLNLEGTCTTLVDTRLQAPTLLDAPPARNQGLERSTAVESPWTRNPVER